MISCWLNTELTAAGHEIRVQLGQKMREGNLTNKLQQMPIIHEADQLLNSVPVTLCLKYLTRSNVSMPTIVEDVSHIHILTHIKQETYISYQQHHECLTAFQ